MFMLTVMYIMQGNEDVEMQVAMELETNGQFIITPVVIILFTGSLLKTCSCGAKCHIRCKKCHNCDTEFIVQTKDFPQEKLVRKHPSSLWRQIQLKVNIVIGNRDLLYNMFVYVG